MRNGEREIVSLPASTTQSVVDAEERDSVLLIVVPALCTERMRRNHGR
jgi:hypothetical protein